MTILQGRKSPASLPGFFGFSSEDRKLDPRNVDGLLTLRALFDFELDLLAFF